MERASRESVVRVQLKCRRCGRAGKHEAPWALIHADQEESARDGWDGVLVGREYACRCGAVDDYDIDALSKLSLLALAPHDRGRPDDEGIHLGEAHLWDGTIVRRPAQAIAVLRKHVTESPTSGPAWRRLGNALNRYGREADARDAWQAALDVDPAEAEAAAALLQGCEPGSDEARRALDVLLQRFPIATVKGDARTGIAALIGFHLRGIAASGEALALALSWESPHAPGGVASSSVDLRYVAQWEALEAFLERMLVRGLRLTPDVPAEPTFLDDVFGDALYAETPQAPYGDGAAAAKGA